MAMLDETHEFLVDMVLKDRPVKNLVAADYTYLNSRLCRYYKLEQDVSQGIQKVDVSEVSHRGGLLTQGAILKVTANGSATSPVVRGAWVAERILGMKIPPPPEGVPAIEPDIRGISDSTGTLPTFLTMEPEGRILRNEGDVLRPTGGFVHIIPAGLSKPSDFARAREILEECLDAYPDFSHRERW